MNKTTPTPPDMPELKSCPDEFRAAMTRVIAIAKAYRADESDGGNYKGANESNRKAIEYAETLLNTRPTPPADAMPTEHAELRLLVRRLARRLPVDDKTRQQADDYLRRTFKASDVLRDDEIVGKPEQTALHPPAPVTDAQREALEEFPEGRNHGDLCRYLDKHEGTIRAALSAPVAQVDVEKLREGALQAAADIHGGILNASKTLTVRAALNYVFDHLTPKTQSEE